MKDGEGERGEKGKRWWSERGRERGGKEGGLMCVEGAPKENGVGKKERGKCVLVVVEEEIDEEKKVNGWRVRKWQRKDTEEKEPRGRENK